VQLLKRILADIREHRLLKAGDRLGVAVSGGADSVALLRVLLELRAELGTVLSIVHFNHKIRGQAAEADEQFVRELAEAHGLELHLDSADVVAVARSRGISLETAARELRYAWFNRLLRAGSLSSIATAHTIDDQAETVLMRLLRGSGTRGLSGIYPVLERSGGTIVRPFLSVSRIELQAYLQALGQGWREDSSNLDLQHTRNRVRHRLIPQLEQHFNPAVTRVLGELAEIARAEEDFWTAHLSQISPELIAQPGLKTKALLRQPVALQRRILRAAAERAGVKLEFQHVEALRHIVANPSSTFESSMLVNGRAVFSGRGAERELRFELGSQTKERTQNACRYEYRFPIPGELRVPETGTTIRASVVGRAAHKARKGLLTAAVPEIAPGRKTQNAGYNQPELLDPRALGSELTVRNWRAGDRYWPAHRKAPKKVKELLQKVAQSERTRWPVIALGSQIVWMRGFPPAADFLLKRSEGVDGILIEELARTESE